ncbi:uncharacterized protein [Eurosta solidaginis]|uniref:uncharacterized protein n=1 Tax=Eurosta solidaginis TaxID=178769 RepID=UPI0035310783
MLFNFLLEGVFRSEYRRQLYAALSVTIITYCNGIGLGWFSPMVEKLQSPASTPLPFFASVEEASWIGALVCMGGVVGNLGFGTILDIYGRKASIYMLAIPHMCFWALIYFATSVEYLYAGRFASGMTGGGTWIVIPIFIGEIADPNIRGRLTSLFTLTLNAGMLTGYIVSAHVPYHIIPLVVILLPLIFLFTETYFPETPSYLLHRGREEQAQESLKFYMNYKGSRKLEIEKFNLTFAELKCAIKEQKVLKDAITWRDFFTRSALKAMSIAIIVMCISLCTGSYTLLSYMSTVFAAIKSDINPDTNTICIGVIQVFGAYIATILVDHFGRKSLLLVSTATMGISLAAFGLYSFVAQETSVDLSAYHSWLPFLIMACIILTANVGLIPVPAIVMVELLPSKIREKAVTFCVTMLSLLAFLAVKIFPPALQSFGLAACMWGYASFAALGLLYVMIFVPETRGRSMHSDVENNKLNGKREILNNKTKFKRKFRKVRTNCKKNMVFNSLSEGVLRSEYRRQFYAALSVTIITYCNGIGLGWFAPMVTKLQSAENTPVNFSASVEEASWIGALVCMGGVVGNLSFGAFLGIFGRKTCIYMLAIPHMCFWALIYFATSVEYLYAGRFASGITGGGTWVVIPIFIGEIADPNIRGRLTSLFTLTLNAGMLTGYIVSAHVPYHIIPMAVILLPMIFLLIETYFPETPSYLLHRGHEEQAQESLKFYMNYKGSSKLEIEKFDVTFTELKCAMKEQKVLKDAITWRDFFTKSALRAMSTAMIVMCINIFTGSFTLLCYMSTVFAAIKTDINPDTNTILIGMVQVGGSYIATILVDHFGRKSLLLVSTATTGISLAAFGLYAFLAQETNVDLSVYNSWLPFLIMACIILTANVGLIPVPAIVMVELLPSKIREKGVSFCVTMLSLVAFLAMKVFPPFLESFGLAVCMWGYASFAALGLLYVMIFVPETKGRAMHNDVEK